MDNYYKKNFDGIISRCRQINSGAKSGALLHINSIREIDRGPGIPDVKPLNAWDFDSQLPEYFDALLDREEAVWSRRTDVEDDRIPSVTPFFGIGEHSAYLGGKVRFEETTSYNTPFIRSWADTDKIVPDKNNIWFRRVIGGIAYMKKSRPGRIAARLRGGCGPAELAGFIRGNDLFTDFYDYPEEVHRLLKVCTKAERWFIDSQLEACGDFEGGILEGMNVWMPHGSFGHLSEDWSYMCSPEMYREFGRAYTDKMTQGFSDVLMHIHSGGAHILPELVKSKNITYIQISSDPNRPSALDIFRKYEDCLRGRIVMLAITGEELKSARDFLKDKRAIFSVDCDTVDEARRVVDYVRTEFPVV